MLGKIFYNIIIFGTIISICIFPLLIFLSKNKYKYNFKSVYKIFVFILILLIIPINIVDFSHIKNVISQNSEKIIENEGNVVKIPEIKFENDQTIIEVNNEINIKNNTVFSVSQIVPYIWISVAGVILIYNLLSYFTFIINQKKHYISNYNNKIDKILSRLCNEMKMKNVSYVISDNIQTPMTVGIFNKKIILSKEILEENEYEFILKHELFHIKNKDIEYKFLLLILNCIYWFNPIIYMFINQIEEILELNCDENVLKGKEQLDRVKYAEILLNQIEITRNKQYKFSMNFANRRKNIMKRFSNIVEKTSKKSIIGIATMSGILLIISTILIVSIPNINFAGIDNIINNEVEENIVIKQDNSSLNENIINDNTVDKDTKLEVDNTNNVDNRLETDDKDIKLQADNTVNGDVKLETDDNNDKDVKLQVENDSKKETELQVNDISNEEYIIPLKDSYTIANHFGVKNNYLVHNNNVTHYGIDLATTGGEDILAVKSGTVVLSAYKGSYGNLVIIEHEDGYKTYYTHCSRLNVNQGEKVNQGDVIAQVGSTGNSTGPHLHFEIRDENNTTLDPEKYIKF